MDECYVRGNHVKYIRVPDDTMASIKPEEKSMYTILHL